MSRFALKFYEVMSDFAPYETDLDDVNEMTDDDILYEVREQLKFYNENSGELEDDDLRDICTRFADLYEEMTVTA